MVILPTTPRLFAGSGSEGIALRHAFTIFAVAIFYIAIPLVIIVESPRGPGSDAAADD